MKKNSYSPTDAESIFIAVLCIIYNPEVKLQKVKSSNQDIFDIRDKIIANGRGKKDLKAKEFTRSLTGRLLSNVPILFYFVSKNERAAKYKPIESNAFQKAVVSKYADFETNHLSFLHLKDALLDENTLLSIVNEGKAMILESDIVDNSKPIPVSNELEKELESIKKENEKLVSKFEKLTTHNAELKEELKLKEVPVKETEEIKKLKKQITAEKRSASAYKGQLTKLQNKLDSK